MDRDTEVRTDTTVSLVPLIMAQGETINLEELELPYFIFLHHVASEAFTTHN